MIAFQQREIKEKKEKKAPPTPPPQIVIHTGNRASPIRS